MATAKIQLRGQFAINRNRAEPLSLQLVRQLQEAIETGNVAEGTQLPSTRSLARTLGVSRNTVLTAYDELAARGFVRGRRGAGMYVFVPTNCYWVRSQIRHARRAVPLTDDRHARSGRESDHRRLLTGTAAAAAKLSDNEDDRKVLRCHS